MTANTAVIDAENHNFFEVGIKAAIKGVSKPNMAQAAGVAVSETNSHADAIIAGTVVTQSFDQDISFAAIPDLSFIPKTQTRSTPQYTLTTTYLPKPQLPNFVPVEAPITPTPTVLSTQSLPDTITFNAASRTIARSLGNWREEGFFAGQLVSIDGTLRNDGIFQVESVSSDGRTLTIRVGYALADEVPITAPVIVGLDTIHRPSGRWSADGFRIGSLIRITDTRFNDGTYHIAGVSQDGQSIAVESESFLQFEQPISINSRPPALIAEVTTRLTFQGVTITREFGTWDFEGAKPGLLHIVDADRNGFGVFPIQSVSADGKVLTLVKGSAFANETLAKLGAGATDQIVLQAESINHLHDVLSKAQSKELNSPYLDGFMKQIGAKFAKAGTSAISVSAGVAFSNGVNESRALIEPTARVLSSGDMTVQSNAEDNFKVMNLAAVKGSAKVQAAAAVSVGNFTNRSQAIIADNAIVTVADDLRVDAVAKIPNQIDLDELFFSLLAFDFRVPPIDNSTPDTTFQSTTAAANQTFARTLQFLPTAKQLKALRKPGTIVGTTLSMASTKALCSYKKPEFGRDGKRIIDRATQQKEDHCSTATDNPETSVAVSGAFTLLEVVNNSDAHVGKSVHLNDAAAPAVSPLPASFAVANEQDVHINAQSFSEMINLGGQDKFFRLNKGNAGNVGVGGTVVIVDMDSTARAFIDDNAVVGTHGNLRVTADTIARDITVAQAGGTAKTVGISGAGTYHDVTSNTLAYIEDTARIEVNKDVLVQAESNLISVIVDGAIQKQKSDTKNPYAVTQKGSGIAVGVAIAINTIENNTLSFIGDLPVAQGGTTADDQATPGFIKAEDISVLSTAREQLYAVGIAGAVAKGQKPSTSCDEQVPADAQSITAGAGDGAKPTIEGLTGIGLAGDVAINQGRAITRAWIEETKIDTRQDVVVDANHHGTQFSVTGVIATAKTGDNAFSLAGAFSLNDVNRTTEAFIQNSTVHANDVRVQADQQSEVGTASGGGAVAAGGAAALIGSANVNNNQTTVQAYLGAGSIVFASGNVDILADNTLRFVSAAGVLSVTGSLGVGAAADVSDIHQNVRAFVADGVSISSLDVTPTDVANQLDNVTVVADNRLEMIAIAASIAVGTKGLGISGSASFTQLDTDVSAFVGVGASILAHGNVLVDAHDQANINVVGGAVGIGLGRSAAKETQCPESSTPGIGFGASAAVVLWQRDVTATVSPSASIEAAGNGAPIIDAQGLHANANGLIVQATASEFMRTIAVTGAGGDQFAAAASVTVNQVQSKVLATIGADTKINQQGLTPSPNQSVIVLADHVTDVLSLTGGVAGAKQVSIGAAASTNDLNREVAATIGLRAQVRAANDVLVTSHSPENILVVSAGIGVGAKTAGLAGSLTLNILQDVTRSQIAAAAVVEANSDLIVHAQRSMKLIPTSGAGGFGNNGGVGASVVTLQQVDTTIAQIDEDAVVIARGQGDGQLIPDDTFTPQGTRGQRLSRGLSVAATATQEVLGISVAGAGAANLGLGGSAVATDITRTTQAIVGPRVDVNVNNIGDDLQSVRVLAIDDTKITSAAGALVGSGSVAAGLSTDVQLIKKNTQALIDTQATVQTSNEVSVEAFAKEDFISVSGSIAIAGEVGVAGTAAVFNLTSQTLATIGSSASVLAVGNVIVSADNPTNLLQVAGGLSGGSSAGVGITAAATVLDKTTLATISNLAIVDGRGWRGTFLAPLGTTAEIFTARSADDPFAVPDINQPEANDPSLSQDRRVTADRAEMRGVAVFATAFDRHLLIGASAGAGQLDVRGVGVVEFSKINTQATIGDDARINAQQLEASPLQSVSVIALTDVQHIGVGGAISASAFAGGTPGADVFIVQMTTRAATGARSVLNANADIRVVATAHEDIVSIAATAGLSGGFAFAGSAAVVQLKNTTEAIVGANSVNFARGNMLVQSRDDTDLDIVSGSLAVGIGTAGFGASVSITELTKFTTASVGAGAKVDVLAQTTNRLSATEKTITATADAKSSVGLQGLAGLVVQAFSSESIMTIAAAGSGGSIAGLAGSVTFTTIDSNTFATLDSGALINQTVDAANVPGSQQSIHVAAVNQVDLLGIGGAITVGASGVGLAGGVDVGLLRNDTVARIQNGARVKAQKDVNVISLAGMNVQSFAASAAAGAIGIAGAVSVYTIGGDLSATALRGLTSNSGNGVTTSSFIDAQASNPAALAALNFGSSDRPGVNGLRSSRQQLSNALPRGVGSGLTNLVAELVGTSASIGDNVRVEAGEDLDVFAQNLLRHRQLAGTGQAGLVGVGGSVVVLDLFNRATAVVGSFSNLSAGTVNPAGSVTISGTMDQSAAGEAFAGAVNGLVGLGAQVVILNDHSLSQAKVNSNSAIERANRFDMFSGGNQIVDARAIGGGVGTITAGVSITKVLIDGSHTSLVEPGVRIGGNIGSDLPATIQVATFQSIVDMAARSSALAVNAGVVSGAGVDSSSTVRPTIRAGVAEATRLKVAFATSILADTNLFAFAVGRAFAGSVLASVGVSFAVTSVTPKIEAIIGADSIVDAGILNMDAILNRRDASVISALATSGAVSTLVGGGALSRTDYLPIVITTIDNKVQLEATSVRMNSFVRDISRTDATGAVAGLIGIGLSQAIMTSSPTVTSRVGDSSVIETIQDIVINADLFLDSEARAQAGALGIVTGSSSEAAAISNAKVVTNVGSNTRLTGRNVSLNSVGLTEVNSRAEGLKDFANGINLSAVKFGVSSATTQTTPIIEAKLGPSSTIQATGSVTVLAHNNLNIFGTPAAGGNSAIATATSATLFIGVEGSRALMQYDGRTNATIDRSSTVNANGRILVQARTRGLNESLASAESFGLLAIGVTQADTSSFYRTEANVNQSANLRAGDDIVIRSASDAQGNANGLTVGGGVVTVGLARGSVDVRYSTSSNVGDLVVLRAGDELIVDSLANSSGTGQGAVKGGAFVQGADAVGTMNLLTRDPGTNPAETDPDYVNAASNRVQIGRDTTLSGGKVRLEAATTRLSLNSQALTDGRSAGLLGRNKTSTSVKARNDVIIQPRALVQADVELIVSSQFGLPHALDAGALAPSSSATSSIQGINGFVLLDSTSSHLQALKINTTIDSAVLEAPNIRTQNVAPRVNFVTETKFIGLGLEVGTESKSRRGHASSLLDLRNAQFNLRRDTPVLIIDENGQIVSQRNLLTRPVVAGIEISGFNAAQTGAIQLIVAAPLVGSSGAEPGADTASYIKSASTIGNGNFDVFSTFDTVRIENRSSQVVFLKSLSIPDTQLTTSNLNLLVGGTLPANRNVRLFNNVSKIKVLSTHPLGVVGVQGVISNPGGVIDIESARSIAALDPNALLDANEILLNVTGGAIQPNPGRLRTRLNPGPSQPRLSAAARDKIVIENQLDFTNGTFTPIIELVSQTAQVDLAIPDATRRITTPTGVITLPVTSAYELRRLIAATDVLVTSAGVSLQVNDVQAPNGLVSLKTNLNIRDKRPDDSASITALNLILDAGTGIGTAAINPSDRMAIDVRNLEARTGSGDLSLLALADLTIGGVNQFSGLTAGGTVLLFGQRRLTLDEPIVAGSGLLITTEDGTDPSFDNLLRVNAPLTSQSAAIIVNSADDLIIGSNAVITATGIVRLTVEQFSPIPLGATLEFAGRIVTTQAITLLTGVDDDTVRLLSPLGGNGAQVLLGDGDDRLTLGNGVTFQGNVQAGTGNNTLDYGLSNQALAIDLTTTTAPQITGSATGFQNVIGTPQADLIIGSAGDNVLSGGGGDDLIVAGLGNDQLLGDAGRDMLLGGGGGDTLAGGDDGDLLLANALQIESGRDLRGNTITDLQTRLRALQQIWLRTDASYEARFDLLKPFLVGLNARSDNSVDVLSGQAGQDMFVKSAEDTISDLEANERVLEFVAPVLRISSSHAVESASQIAFTITLDGDAGTDFNVNLNTADGSAQAGSDYVANTFALQFAGLAGESRQFSVSLLNDAVFETLLERFEVRVSSTDIVGTDFLTAVGTGTIEDDEPLVLVVNSTQHTPDVNLGDGLAIDRFGQTSLLAAIQQANASKNRGGTPDRIEFDIPGGDFQTIQVRSSYPSLTESVIIDGRTQAGLATPTITLDGRTAASIGNGFVVRAPDVQIIGLAIGGFGRDGISVLATQRFVADGNWIGLAADGTLLANGQNGVQLNQVSDARLEDNVISGNRGQGVLITGSASKRNALVGNRIGTDHAGQQGLGNQKSGVRLQNRTASNQLRDNLIAGNATSEIVIADKWTRQNVIASNIIGTNLDGDQSLSQTDTALVVQGDSNTIGGLNESFGNLIVARQTGIRLMGADAKLNIMQNNSLGVSRPAPAQSLSLPTGVVLQDGATNNQVLSNVVVSPLSVRSETGGNGNRISKNTFIGAPQPIDLGARGTTANDAGDADEGPNRLQNSPTLSNVRAVDAQNIQLTVALSTAPAAAVYPMVVEFYLIASGASNRAYVTRMTLTDGEPRSIRIAVNPALVAGQRISATATDARGNTSEFSPPLGIGNIPSSTTAARAATQVSTETDSERTATEVYHEQGWIAAVDAALASLDIDDLTNQNRRRR